MKQSDVAYIKAMLWGIFCICRNAELSEPIFWIAFCYMLFYGIEFIFYRIKENNE